jgi:uncharacterized protein (DUF488 family)
MRRIGKRPGLVTFWTIGHSNVPLESFLALLRGNDINMIVDVRRYPASRRHPHFAGEALQAALEPLGIGYLHLPELGGRRTARADSPNTAWRHPAFRGYADYMDTPSFVDGLSQLVDAASTRRAAIMCAEALWWQCHRGLIADVRKAAGHTVLHITASGVQEHPYTSAARIVDGKLSYSEPSLPLEQ